VYYSSVYYSVECTSRHVELSCCFKKMMSN